jgi:hypothetical protein
MPLSLVVGVDTHERWSFPLDCWVDGFGGDEG